MSCLILPNPDHEPNPRFAWRSPETLERVRAAKAGDEAATLHVLQDLAGMIQSAYRTWIARGHAADYMDRDEWEAEAICVVLVALQGYDPDHESRTGFQTYAFQALRNAAGHVVRNSSKARRCLSVEQIQDKSRGFGAGKDRQRNELPPGSQPKPLPERGTDYWCVEGCERPARQGRGASNGRCDACARAFERAKRAFGKHLGVCPTHGSVLRSQWKYPRCGRCTDADLPQIPWVPERRSALL